MVVEARPAYETKASVVFDGVRFSHNGDVASEVFGAAVRADSCRDGNCRASSLRFTRCRFSGNRALIGGAIFASDADVLLTDCDFEGNEAAVAGGAVYISGMQREIVLKTNRVNFTGNRAHGDKEELEMTPAVPMLDIDETMRTAGRGGAIYASNIAQLRIKQSDFTKNVACEGGGAIAALNVERLSSSNLSHPFSIDDGTFLENEAFCGPQPDALRLSYYRRGLYHRIGGALRFEALNDESLGWRIKNSSFLDNRAHSGGAVCLISTSDVSATEHTIESSVFDSNIALARGGAIAINRIRLTMQRSNITNGRSVVGGGVYSISASRVTFIEDTDDPSVDSVIEGNVAVGGGGINSDSGE